MTSTKGVACVDEFRSGMPLARSRRSTTSSGASAPSPTYRRCSAVSPRAPDGSSGCGPRSGRPPPAERGVLLSLSTPVDGHPFVPGLYRLLARWPGFVAHVATVLQPHFRDPETRVICRRLLEAVDAELPAVFAALPPLSEKPPAPPQTEFAGVLAALDAYRKTSPEMVVFSRLIRDALPAARE